MAFLYNILKNQLNFGCSEIDDGEECFDFSNIDNLDSNCMSDNKIDNLLLQSDICCVQVEMDINLEEIEKKRQNLEERKRNFELRKNIKLDF